MPYSEAVLRLFHDPAHVGTLTSGCIGELQARQNGEHVKFFLSFEGGLVSCIRYQVKGSVVTMAVCEYVARELEGQPFKRLPTSMAILAALALPPVFIHSAELVRGALLGVSHGQNGA